MKKAFISDTIVPMESTKRRVLSGVQPSGRLHIGNYFGAIKQFVALQETHDCTFMIADLHALNTVQDEVRMRQQIFDIVVDYLALGIDPKKCIIFKQSAVLAHPAMAWIFDTLTTMPYLMRAHAFKDAEAKNKEISVGVFNYPLLMASDILLYSPDIVPVGADQKQHVEIARDAAEKFNRIYKPVFKIPEAYIMSETAVVPGTDGRKMSKSYNNTIPLFATDEEITKAVMSIPTDSKGKDEEKNPDDIVLYQIHKLFDASDELRARYTSGLGYKDAKELLIKDLIAFIAPLRERRAKYEQDPKLVQEILLKGAMCANEVAMRKLTDVYEAVGLTD
ncbi:MAG TPA: tryptophan--tRNA ligase [Candidatus Paceibacterota bacterium]|nr:tryptophan--tRNA ligase [Candidatus Paceibacterota bacterium]